MRLFARRRLAIATGLTASLLITAVMSATSSASAAQESPPSITAGECTELVGLQIRPKDFDLPTGGAVVESATWQPQGYCAVTGWIRAVSASEDMQFRVNLPALWNQRTLQFGGGGYDGTLVTATGAYVAQPIGSPTALSNGWVTLGSDGGHQGAVFDGSFMLEPELLLTYGQQSVKKAHDAAYAVIDAAYGMEPKWSYFIGGSQGGHEAIDAAARYPKDYDGVIANYPSYNVTMLNAGAVNVRDALQLGAGTGHLNPAELTAILNAVNATCDPLDGAEDGIVSNTGACNDAFDVSSLACADDTVAEVVDTCLSETEIAAALKLASDYDLGIDIEGNSTYARSALLEGAIFQGYSGFGPGPQQTGLHADLLTGIMRWGVLGNPDTFDFATVDPHAYPERLEELGEILDVTDVSLRQFRAHGGKMILTHGTTDPNISPHNTELYYAGLKEEFGTQLGSFVKFYEIPGWGHGAGTFNAKFDGLDAIVAWVERGTPPTGLVAQDGNPGADRTRPMCEYPSWPSYKGFGSIDQASSFRCVTE